MTPVVASCPSCSAPIHFAIGSAIVVICQNCRSAVARTDRALEDLGKVAAVVESDSPLQVGLKGAHRGKPFEIVGRIQYRHESGALWNEWYASFPEDKWGWLAEAQGKFYLTFEGKLSKDAALPGLGQLTVGQQFTVPSVAKFTVAEIGRAAAEGAEGEIPFRFTPGESHDYADLAAGGGKFATFDYGQDPPSVFVGREVTLGDLDLESEPLTQREAKSIGGVTLNCPQCSGSLDLRAPDETLRVTCPYCNSLLDVTQGKLKYLTTLDGGEVKPLIPIGTIGSLEGISYTVIGFVQRQVTLDGTVYFWQEYLLYSAAVQFRWLVQSDNHWSFVRSISPGEVEVVGNRRATYEGRTFKLFQLAQTYVSYVMGEFYWRVSVGEVTLAGDYVRPPQMLSREKSGTDVKGEINWSLGTYMTKEVVAEAFKIKKMPRPMGVAPNQPFLHNGVLLAWPLMCGVALLAGIMLIGGAKSRVVFDKNYNLAPVEAADKTNVEFESPLELHSRQNVCITLRSPVNNTWVYVEGDLINDETGLVQGFSAPLEYYQGTEGGEAWSEGRQQATIYLSALPEGKYTLRLEVQRQNFSAPASVAIKIEQNRPRVGYLVLLLLALSVVPALVLFWRWQFEKTRWENSDYGG
ncbi:MAG: DUF4178 domain-containing protein [Planctomycetes bacterium]|nr:DUF4178 domain-containing protein [Planctomycetota bacterium]